jgi:two-component system CheB/CheR fusion protein
VAKDDEVCESVLRLLSHDLRNPLTAVQLNAQLIERAAAQAGHAKEQRWAALIAAAAHRMDGMIQQLVESERLRSGRIRLALAPVDLAGLLHDLLAQGRTADEPSRIRLTLPEQPVVVTADPVRLRLAIANLLGLILRETDSAGTAGLDVTAQDGEACCSLHAPRPSGSGEGWADLRADGKPPQPGQGLALHVARTLIECHGGRLCTLADDPNRLGFDVVLPVRAE